MYSELGFATLLGPCPIKRGFVEALCPEIDAEVQIMVVLNGVLSVTHDLIFVIEKKIRGRWPDPHMKWLRISKLEVSLSVSIRQLWPC